MCSEYVYIELLPIWLNLGSPRKELNICNSPLMFWLLHQSVPEQNGAVGAMIYFVCSWHTFSNHNSEAKFEDQTWKEQLP